MVVDAAADAGVDICFALGGDGTILNALRTYAGTGVPVFAINFGEMGFLATVDREDAQTGSERALAGDFEVMSLPGIELVGDRGRWLAVNDVSMHRQQGKRVADLEYAVGGDEVGRVRCDGLVVATPAGSTGYNLANGGPVMAWGVHGYVVSFIAPHSFTARTLVVAPDDQLSVHNRSHEEPVDVIVDGRPVCVLEPARAAPGPLRDRPGLPGPDPRHDLLPAPAAEVRAAGHPAVTRSPRTGAIGPCPSGAGGRPWPCSTNCASRTCS